ncbi:hypothetical protein [Aeoliella sp. SH292]|uniref:hypothetical protein n=1 Tax=Aeoliella sp. SH292 TaxID=3454464 RepID=UPI003F98EFF8
MVAFIAFMALLNLSAGYVLGVYFGVCPGITPLSYDAEDDDDEVLGLTLSDALSPVAQSTIQNKPTLEADTSAPVPPNPQNVATILAGLGEFKAKLEQVSVKLASAAEDRGTIDDCAGEMKVANTEYLECTAEAIQSLNVADAAASSAGDPLLRQKLQDHSAEVRRVNIEIEGLATEQDIEKVRQMLLASSDQLTQTAAVIEYTLGDDAPLGESPVSESPRSASQSTEAPSTEAPPTEAKATEAKATEAKATEAQTSDLPTTEAVANRVMGGLDSMMALLDQEIGERAEDQPLVVAKLAMKPAAGVAEGSAEDLLRGIASLVASELATGQAMFTDPEGQLALTLAGDDEHTASERCERIRQRVASTTFRQGEEDLMADLLCSLTDTRRAVGSKDVLGRLEAGLAKAASHGPGCTIFHNGDSLTIVAPSELDIEPQVVEL